MTALAAALAPPPNVAPLVGIFYTGADRTQDRVLAAFAAGIPAAQRVDASLDLGSPTPIDIAVVYGTRKRGVALAEKRWRIIEAMRAGGGQTLIIESGYVRPKEHFSIAWGDINGRGDHRMPVRPDAARWDALGVPLQPWRWWEKGHVLLCGQRPHGSGAMGLDDYRAWERQTAATIRSMGLSIKVRPHPGMALVRPLALDLAEARACVTWNTTAGVEAVIAGVPTIALDEGSMAWPVAGHSLADLKAPPMPDRTEWAHRLAWCQWTLAEMEDGTAWRWLTRA